MTRARQQQILLAVLVGVMVLVYARALRPRHPAGPSPAPAPAVAGMPAAEALSAVPSGTGQAGASVAPAAAAQPQELAKRREAQRAEAEELTWSRDPFTRSVVTGRRSGLQLSGILWDATSPVAIINGEMRQVGQEVDGYRVVEITPSRVLLSDGTDIFQLTFSP